MPASRLGPDFTRLWAAFAVSGVGDGLTLAAGPLLLATLTDDPALVAGAVFAQRLPWLLFSLVSGVVVDRLDRRRLVAAVDTARAVVVGALALAVWTGHAGVGVVYACLFLLGTGNTLVDNAVQAMVPAVVASDDLPTANSRITAVGLIGGKMAGPPLGSLLFVTAAALPFGIDAASFAIGALLVLAVRNHPTPAPAPRKPLRNEIGEGLRWLWGHHALRMLALCLALLNFAWTGGSAVMVLYARERLGLDEVGFGLMLSTVAAGGIVGAFVAAPLVRRFGAAVLLRVGLVVESLTHLGLALATTPWVALSVLAAFGVHAVVWNVITQTVRQRAVPEALRGRVMSVLFLLSIGGATVGSLLGGVLARGFGITAPYWFGAVLVAGVAATAWRSFSRVDAENPAAA
ncbi:MFS transporter [Actinosynnema sp. NPDC020468]|uniref:MFS transporter n=1 Tax=Actinosynnema sp. NPDC020468 TaxID=3154488 RepID=UPI0033D7A14F